MAKKRPSLKALRAARSRHAQRAIRETLVYTAEHPDKSAMLEHAWRGCVTVSRKPHFKDYIALLQSDMPILATNFGSGDP